MEQGAVMLPGAVTATNHLYPGPVAAGRGS